MYSEPSIVHFLTQKYQTQLIEGSIALCTDAVADIYTGCRNFFSSRTNNEEWINAWSIGINLSQLLKLICLRLCATSFHFSPCVDCQRVSVCFICIQLFRLQHAPNVIWSSKMSWNSLNWFWANNIFQFPCIILFWRLLVLSITITLESYA